MAEDLDWVRGEIDRLGGLSTPDAGDVVPALEFLRLHAGGQSEFYQRATAVTAFVPRYAVQVIMSVLEGWIAFVEDGLAKKPIESQIRTEAATDLMEQVQVQLDDATVHPAAPVMLTGAALEEFLRSMLVDCPTKPHGRPGIASYADALLRAELLSPRNFKEINAWAALRNSAERGEFDAISLEQARLMALGVNLFMQQKS